MRRAEWQIDWESPCAFSCCFKIWLHINAFTLVEFFTKQCNYDDAVSEPVHIRANITGPMVRFPIFDLEGGRHIRCNTSMLMRTRRTYLTGADIIDWMKVGLQSFRSKCVLKHLYMTKAHGRYGFGTYFNNFQSSRPMSHDRTT